MKCPHCKTPTLVMAERSGIEIDHCPECRGVWLDRGELDKILERNRTEDSPRFRDEPPPRYEKEYRPEKGYYKKRKSFLEDLFD